MWLLSGFWTPNPGNNLPGSFPCKKQHVFLPFAFPCPAHQGSPLLLTLNMNNMSHTASGCQKNDCKQISGQLRERRKSIICQHSTCVFRGVTHCAQTDNYPSWGYKEGRRAESTVWCWKQRFPSTNHIIIQDAAWLVWHARHQLLWTRRHYYEHL